MSLCTSFPQRPFFASAAILIIVSLAPSALFAQTGHKTTVHKESTTTTTTTAPQKTTYMFVEQMPVFKGDLTSYLSKNIHYPDSSRVRGSQGKSIVRFIVDEQGHVSEAELARSSGDSLLDAEALRAVRSMPPWVPGTQQGKAVSVYYTLPVVFRLE